MTNEFREQMRRAVAEAIAKLEADAETTTKSVDERQSRKRNLIDKLKRWRILKNNVKKAGTKLLVRRAALFRKATADKLNAEKISS